MDKSKDPSTVFSKFQSLTSPESGWVFHDAVLKKILVDVLAAKLSLELLLTNDVINQVVQVRLDFCNLMNLTFTGDLLDRWMIQNANASYPSFSNVDDLVAELIDSKAASFEDVGDVQHCRFVMRGTDAWEFSFIASDVVLIETGVSLQA